jgi:type IV secretion system protein VirD4
MVSRQEVPRPLLTPGEVMQLPHADALILTGGAPPIRAKKVRYFAEPLFKARLRPPFASPRHSPKGLPTAWSGLIASTAPLPERSQSTSSRRASGSGHTQAQDQSEQSLQQAFNFSTPAAGEPTQTNSSESQSTAQASDDLGAAFTGPGLARTVFAFNPDHFDTDV